MTDVPPPPPPSPGRPGGQPLAAGIVLGLVGTVATIAFLLVVVVGVGKAARNFAGVADPKTCQLTTDSRTCATDQLGFVTFTGTIKHTTSIMKNFTVNTEIRNSSTNAAIDSLMDIVTAIAPGDTTQWKSVATVDQGMQPSCEVTSVENFLN